MSESKVVQEALARLKFAVEADAAQRGREKEDLQFQVPECQWPEAIKAQRGADTLAGVPIPPRPMLSIPKLDQPIQLVLNQEKAAQLGVQVHALSEDATDDTAEVIQGLYRRIEVDSRANLARSWAFERAVKAGRGAYRVLKEYADDGGDPFDQKITIKRILHQEAAYFDPTAQEPDWSDGRWAFITEWMPLDRYKAKYGKSKLAKMNSDELKALAEDTPGWVRADDDAGDDTAGRAVLVAEYFRIESTSKTRRLLRSGHSAYDDAIPDGDPVLPDDEGGKSRDEDVPSVKWSKINGVEELEKEDWDGRYIPLIPTIGRELIPWDGERRWTGIIGPNKDAQRAFNYAASGAIESAALEPKAPFDVDPEEIEGFEPFWIQANARNFPYLPRHKFKGAREYGPIQRIQADMSKVQMNSLLLQMSGDFIHAGTGAFEPSLGQNSPNVRTKGATLALQQQHDQGNSNWLDNLAEISLTYEAKVVLDLIPHIYDRPGRIVRILDIEDEAETVMLNQPYALDPATKRVQPVPPDHPKAKHFDLKKGRYGVSVSVGKAYKSLVEEESAALSQLMQAEPMMVPIVGPEWAKAQSWPGHERVYDVLKKTRDHQMPWLAEGDDQVDPKQEVAKLTAENQHLKQQVQEAADMIKTKQVEQQAKIAVAKIDADKQILLQTMKDATSIAVAKITLMGKGVIAAQESEDEAIALGQQHAFDAQQAEGQRQHEAELARMGAAQAADASAQEHGQGLAAGDQSHAQALEQGQQQVDGQLEVQAAAPQPKTGA